MNIIVMVLFLNAVNVWAGEVSLIEKNTITAKKTPVKEKSMIQEKKAAKAEPIDQGFEQMKEFIQQENERLKAIKILNLDLERADLELKKGEIEVKIAGLNRGSNAAIAGLSTGISKPAVVKLCGILMNGDDREALVNMDGIYVQIKEGFALRNGALVRKVSDDAVVLEYADGKKETISLGS